MAEFMREKKCKVCEKSTKSIDINGACIECQDEIKAGKIIICKNDSCSKKIGANSKNGMCNNCNISNSACLQCGKISKNSLDEYGICQECKNPPISKCIKCGKDSENEICQECKNKDEVPPSSFNLKKFIPIAIAGVVTLIAIIYFIATLPDKSTEDKVVKKKPIKSMPIYKDTTPNSFAFVQKNNVNLNNEIESNIISISGINAPSKIKIINGEYSINGNSWKNTESIINNGNNVKVKHISNNSYNSFSSTTLSIGEVSAYFQTRTKMEPVAPPSISQEPSPIIDNNSDCSDMDIARGKRGC